MSTQIHPSDNPDRPDLRIVQVADLIEHEFNDIERTRPLAERLEAEGILKNPPVVTPLQDENGKFVVLDGANRITALQILRYQHILVQVVPYRPPQVTLTTWHHIIMGLDSRGLTSELSTLEGIDLILTDPLRARAGLARREYLMYVIRVDGEVFAARSSEPAHEARLNNTLLNALVDTYKDRSVLHRVMTEDLVEANRLFPGMAGLVVFPQFDPSEVLELAADGELLPAGLTRHLIQGRALRINYPLNELKDEKNLEEKNLHLKRWMDEKFKTREVRFYGETTYLFDE
jgi:L-serine kinase (ATP) / ParB family transcriptional regulator, heme-responsive regulator